MTPSDNQKDDALRAYVSQQPSEVSKVLKTRKYELPERHYHFWPIAIPWLVVIGMIVFIIWVSSKTQISCHYTGDLITPLAQAAKSEAGIPVDEAVEAPPVVIDKKKTVPLAKKESLSYGPAK